MFSMLKSIWKYRHFILSSIRNELVSRFARSKIGAAWLIFNPLTQVLMYAVVLSAVISTKLPGIDNRFSYAIYITAGILAWTLFSELVLRCLTIFIDNGNLIKKVAFPKICLPVIVSGSILFNYLILFLTIVTIFSLLGHVPTSSLFWLPFLTLVTLLLGVSIGLILGILNVFMRDVGSFVPVIMQFGFWFTPIVYPASIIPDTYRAWIEINPMFHIVSGYQSILVYNQAPNFSALITIGFASVVLLAIALTLFRKSNAEMVDAL